LIASPRSFFLTSKTSIRSTGRSSSPQTRRVLSVNRSALLHKGRLERYGKGLKRGRKPSKPELRFQEGRVIER
jgi:hypothetical protein